ncbi:MAG: hypothetical protein HYT16_02710 [DPANN group archaeon]|nr:hypothetical protein [DPANN group archaeon]
MDINEFMEGLAPDNILKRTRPIDCVADFADVDTRILEDILDGRKTRPELEESAKQIAIRFTLSKSAPRLEYAGSAGSLFVKVELNGNSEGNQAFPWNDLRFKINPSQVEHNLQHILFLKSLTSLSGSGEGGWSAAVLYGPSDDAPLYIGMVDGVSSCKVHLPTENGRTVLDGLLNYIIKYGTYDGHVRSNQSQLVKDNLRLIETRVMSALAHSEILSDESKTHFATRLNTSIKHLYNKVGPTIDATCVLTDAIAENFTILPGDPGIWPRLTAPRKPIIVVYDQGYSRQTLESWRAVLGRETNPKFSTDAFWGRFEYNLGQMLAAVQMDENVAGQLKDDAIKFVEDLIVNGENTSSAETFFGGSRAKIELPKIDSTLSRGYVSLGIAHVLLNVLANSGENPVIAKTLDKVLDALDSDGMLFKIYPDINPLKKGLVP